MSERAILALAVLGATVWVMRKAEDDAQSELIQWARDQGRAMDDDDDTLKASIFGLAGDLLGDALNRSGGQGGGQGGFSDILSALTGRAAGTPAETVMTVAAGTIRPPSVGTAGTLRPILDLIGRAEAPRGYDQVWGGIAREDHPPRPITQMTVGEVLAWQDSIDRKYMSEASGRYQIMEDTLRDLVRKGEVRTTERFSPATQDRLAVALMRRRGLERYQRGDLHAVDFGENLAREWAGLPRLTGPRAGESFYAGKAGNKATVTPSEVLAALNSVEA
ncbi:MAG: hypothetical protein AAGA71_01410 [Pseudomonadota bacterium]